MAYFLYHLDFSHIYLFPLYTKKYIFFGFNLDKQPFHKYLIMSVPNSMPQNTIHFLMLFLYPEQVEKSFYTSISAMILSISSRSTCSLATIVSISAFNFTISIFSLVSSCSTYDETERL